MKIEIIKCDITNIEADAIEHEKVWKIMLYPVTSKMSLPVYSPAARNHFIQ